MCDYLNYTQLEQFMNTRLAVATHILAFLRTQNGRSATSELIASSVNTNPALIRRHLAQLAKSGLTTSQMGSGGGALLARPAEMITLLDVYRAVEGNQKIIPVHEWPNPLCPVGRQIQSVLVDHVSAVEKAMMDELSKITIANVADEIVAANERTA
jgi:Rrf2 family protein